MNHIQGSSLTGYVTIAVKGNMPELFFQTCAKRGIPVWNVKKEADNICTGNIRLADVKHARKIKRELHVKIAFTKKSGFPFVFKRFTRKKELIAGLLLSILLIMFLSNIIWEIKIIGVTKEVEEKIEKQLESYGIHSGTWTFAIDPPTVIQQKLENDIPELLWIGVNQKGTTYYLEGVEKQIVKEKESPGPRNLVASKKGVITYMYVAKGQPKVAINDYVEPGDLLVSGVIDFEEIDKEDDGEKKDKPEIVAAEGEIIAQTWYETKVTIPLKTETEKLTGNREMKYYLKMGKVQLPIWGFGSPDFNNVYVDPEEKPLFFFKWELPVKLVKTAINEKVLEKKERTKEEAKQAGIQQAKEELMLRLGPDAKIISEKVLHESIGNGKVELILYMKAEEDIAKSEPINQGD